MSYEIPGFTFTLPAAGTLVQYTGVQVNSSGQAAIAADNADIVGVVQNKPTVGQAATIMVNGVTIMRVGEALVAGDNVAVDALGEAITAATTGDTIIGVALEAAADGEYAAVLLRPAATLAL